MNDDDIDKKKRERGLAMLDAVYGPGASAMMQDSLGEPFTATTVDALFADVWSRPHLSIRDRRLLVLGATAMLGRPDLIEVQVRGALLNGELNDDQLRELVLHLAYYTGWGNATALHKGIEAAKKKLAGTDAE